MSIYDDIPVKGGTPTASKSTSTATKGPVTVTTKKVSIYDSIPVTGTPTAQPTGPATPVATGRKTIFDDIPGPTPAPAPAPKGPSVVSKVSNAIGNSIDRPSNKTTAPELPANYASLPHEEKVKVNDEFQKANAEWAKKNNFWHQLPSSFVESLPFGLGSAFTAIHDSEADGSAQYIDNSAGALLKEVPGATLEVGKGFVKAPIQGALDVAGAVKQPFAKDGAIKFKIPGLGEVSNAQYKVAQRISNGEDPLKVTLEEGSGAILDTLFFASLASKPFVGRQVTTARMDVPASDVANQNLVTGLQPRSFRLYEPVTDARPLSPDFIAQSQARGADFGPNFDPNLPTYFKTTFKPSISDSGFFRGEVVQIKPSFFNTLISKFGTATDPSYTYTVKDIGSSGHDLDRAIESGDIPMEKVFKNSTGVLQPEYANHVISDLAGKLDDYKPGLGDTFKASVDAGNSTPTVLNNQALAILRNEVTHTGAPSTIPVPVFPTPAQIKATPESQLIVHDTKEVTGKDIQEGLKNPVVTPRAPKTANTPSAQANASPASPDAQLASIKGGEPLTITNKTNGTEIPANFISKTKLGVMATEPKSGLPIHYRHSEFAFKVPAPITPEVPKAEIPKEPAPAVTTTEERPIAPTGENGPATQENLSTPEAVATELIRTYVERGDTLAQLRNGGMSRSGPNSFSAGIGGFVNGKNVGNDKIIVHRLGDGTELNPPAVIPLKQIFDAIKAEAPAPKKSKRIGMMDYDPSYTPHMNELIKEAQDNGDSFPFSKMSPAEQKILDDAWKNAMKEAFGAEPTPKEPAPKKEVVQEKTPKKIEKKEEKEVKKPVAESKPQEKAPAKPKKPKVNGSVFEMKKGPSGKGEADIDAFRNGAPIELGSMDKIRPIEFPELVDLARELAGKVPEIKRKMGNKLGVFSHSNQAGDFGIGLRADIFEDPEQAAKILAHEIGHLVDYLPDETMARGNLLGRLHTLRKFMSTVYGDEGALDLKEIKNEATKEVLKETGHTFGEMVSGKLPEEVKAQIKARYNEMVTATGGIKDADIRKELMDVSLFWRPVGTHEPVTNDAGEIEFGEDGKPVMEFKEIPLEKMPKSYQNYRKSSKELYADALSMLFNTPGTLEKMAPKFYEEFFKALDAKPDVFNAYFELQELLGGDREALLERRRAGVRGMFDKGDIKSGDIQKGLIEMRKAREKDVWFNFKFNVVDKNFALIDRVNKLKKAGTEVPDDENPVYFLEERNYLGGKIKAFMEKEVQPVYQELQKNDISWNDFGEALFYDRIRAGDRSDVANPRGITPKAAEELLTKMFKDLGEERAKILADNMEKFRESLSTVTEEAFQEGLYKPEMHDQMMENKAYSTFQVLDHLEDGMTSKVHKSIGTLKDIANPADASLLKTISVLRAIERNKVSRSVVEFLQKNFPEDIKEADTVRTPKGPIPKESRLPYHDLVTYMKDGKSQGYYVDPYIAKSVANENIGHTIGILRIMNSAIFRPLFITFNPGFQAFNFIRDLLRFWKNTPGMSFAGALKRYKEAIPVAKARAFGLQNDLMQKMEKEQILSISYNQLVDGADVEEKQIDNILKTSGIDSFQPKVRYKAMEPFVKVLEYIKDLGDFVETLPKVAGYLELTKGDTVPITKEQKSFLRRNIGSPDFLAGGYWKPLTNEVFLFSNAITQGIRSDVGVATDPKTRSGYWFKTAKVNILPKILMILAGAGLFGEKIKEMMDKASEYDKTNYIVVPLGTDENGKTIYFRVPQDEGGRLVGGLIWKALNAGNNNQSAMRDLIDIGNFTAGQLPSVSPTITSAVATSQYLAGQNPYDTFRNRNVLTDDQFKAGGKYAAKPFFGWLFNQAGGGVFYTFSQTAPRDQSGPEKFFNLPVVGNVAGRFVKVSDYGQTETLNQIKANVQQEQSRERLDENEVINKYIKDAQGSQDEVNIQKLTAENKKALVEEILGGPPKSADDVTRAGNIVKKYQIGLQRGEADPNVNALINASTNDEKIQLVKEMKDRLSTAEFNKLRITSLKYKIASDEVFIKAIKIEKK